MRRWIVAPAVQVEDRWPQVFAEWGRLLARMEKRMTALRRFSVEHVAQEQRLAAWRDTLNTAFRSPLGSGDVIGRADFSAELAYADIGNARVCKITAEGHRAEHPVIAAPPPRGCLVAVLQVGGRTRCEYEGADLVLEEGQWALFPPNGYRITHEARASQFVVFVPRVNEPAESSKLTAKLCRVFGRQAGTERLLIPFVQSAFDQVQSGRVDEGVSAIVGHLVEMTLSDEPETIRESMRDTFSARVKYYIEQNVRDHRFSIDAIAKHMKCTKRHVHKMFSSEAVTLAEYIMIRRLELAKADIAAVAPRRRRTITEIAYSCGFNSTSHFSRVFRERFGVTPTDLRDSFDGRFAFAAE
jgi:AraC-like DNA-binding protein